MQQVGEMTAFTLEYQKQFLEKCGPNLKVSRAGHDNKVGNAEDIDPKLIGELALEEVGGQDLVEGNPEDLLGKAGQEGQEGL
jgi:hypothetical protein